MGTTRAATAILLAAGLSLAAVAARADPTIRPVRVETIHRFDPHPAMTLSGTISARIQAALAFRVAGKVIERPVNIGDRVAAGAIIARLDPTDLHLATEAAGSAAIAAAADARRSVAELARYRALGQGSPAFIAEELDRRIAAADAAAARLEQARREYALAQAQESYATLRADADGVIAALPVDVGQVVAAGQTVAELAHGGETEVAVDIPESRLADLRGAATIEVSGWSAPNHVVRGQLRELAGVADPASRTFAARISLAREDAATLALGSTVTVSVRQEAGPLVAILPSSALTGDGAVWVLDEATHKASLRPVTIAGYDGQGHVIIADGLRDGEQVITAGADLVGPDMRLTAWQGPSR